MDRLLINKWYCSKGEGENLKEADVVRYVDSIPGWLNTPVVRLLYRLAQSVTGQGNVVEIGTWHGKSTICLALGLDKSGSSAVVYAIDPHHGSQEHNHLYGSVDTYESFQQTLARFGMNHRVTPLRMESAEAIQEVQEPVELLWIDGDHDYASVKQDFELWFPKLVEGGWIVFHDSKWPGVRRVLWEDLYRSRQVGLVRRIEDTTYARKLKKNSPTLFVLNQVNLKLKQVYQWTKRLKRRFRKNNRRKS